jgi:hypothetical protein
MGSITELQTFCSAYVAYATEMFVASFFFVSGNRNFQLLYNPPYGRKGPASLTMRHPSNPQKLALTSLTSGGRLVGIVRSRTKATELVITRLRCRACKERVCFWFLTWLALIFCSAQFDLFLCHLPRVVCVVSVPTTTVRRAIVGAD